MANAVIVTVLAIYWFVFPGIILLSDLSDPRLRQPYEIPRAAWRVHHALTQRYERWARERIASGKAAHLQLYDVPSTEWPLFGSVFYLSATEALQEEWDRDPSRSRQAPRDYARKTIDACTDLLLDPVHHTWVRQHWGADYFHRENVFFRGMIIQALTSRERLLHDGQHLDLLRDQVETLAAELDQSPHGLLHDYPGECYPVDVFAAVACIRRADTVLGTDHSAFAQRALRGFSAPYLDERGLIPYSVELTSGKPDSSSRGIGMSYVLIYATELYPKQARRWYELYVQHFWQENWLASGFREYPKDMPNRDWLMDPDSGPVMFGFSPSGNAYGVAAARVNGRFDHAWTLGAQALTAAWPLPDGSWLGARLLSAAGRGHAPYLGEMNLLFLFTRQPASGIPIVTGGHLPLLVWIGFALTFGGGLLLLALAARCTKKWLLNAETAHIPLEHTQLALWVALLLISGMLALVGKTPTALLVLLLAQLLPRQITPRRLLVLFLLTGLSVSHPAPVTAANAAVRELHLYKTYGDNAEIFDRSVNVPDLDRGVGYFLLRTVENCRSNAAAQGKSPSSIGSMGGRWLEWAVLVALREKKLTPAYWQAEFAAVPNAFNDVMLWSKAYGPVILSCKTSLRERYKQADLEAVALRQHFPNAKFFLITLDDDKRHVARIRQKIANKELLALQAVYDEANVDQLFAFLKTLTLSESDAKLLRSGRLVR